jgi:hypothetical protein
MGDIFKFWTQTATIREDRALACALICSLFIRLSYEVPPSWDLYTQRWTDITSGLKEATLFPGIWEETGDPPILSNLQPSDDLDQEWK